MNFLGGVCGGNLLNSPEKLRRLRGNFFGVQHRRRVRAEGFSIGVVGIGLEPKTHSARVTLAAVAIETCKPRGPAQRHDKYACR